MRKSIVNGNGCTCDVCHCTLYPDESIKIKSYVLKEGDSTGRYITIGKMDACNLCYDRIFGKYIKEKIRRFE